ncbi:MAG: heavy-metal-associated domain-containing protein [Candidatus Kapabacteria bacterium]|nr:heavy-metal-associated domain-containing protein [Ignavibacteriota bacterium]MCW5885855.1 heavy-metal-associated domain-containing protein [Candidatus Kapabacteria bacterium]
MKKLNLSLITAILLLAVTNLFAADTKEVNIQTNLHCGSCASKIEKGLKKSSGVMEAKSNVESKVVTVKYDASKTDETKITKAISKMGYDAEVVANKKSDGCCSTDKSTKSSGKDCCDTKATKSAPKK